MPWLKDGNETPIVAWDNTEIPMAREGMMSLP